MDADIKGEALMSPEFQALKARVDAARAAKRAERSDPEGALKSNNARFIRDTLKADTDAERARLIRVHHLNSLAIRLWDPANGTLLERMLHGIMPDEAQVMGTPSFLSDLADARRFAEVMLPGFWVSSGTCALSGHCGLGPDYNGPERERLLREWPEDGETTWDEDIEGEGGAARECRAILLCAVRALAYRAERGL